MATSTTRTNKPIIPRGQDASPKQYNRAALYSGKALDFDGVNDEVNCGDVDLAFSEISFAFHFNADSFSNNCILQKESVFRFIGVNTNQIDIVLATTGNSWYSKKMTLTNLESKDYFLVATYNGSELKAYLNGVLVDTLGGYSGSVASVSQNVYVGRTNAGLYYNGKVSGVRIFNTALTAAQISDLYNNPEKIVPTGVSNDALKLWLPMMEGAGTTAYDGSGNGNHGTISGATWTHGIGAPVSQTAVIDWNKGTNLITNSEDDSGKSVANGSTTDNSIVSPNGLTTGGKYQENTTSGNHGIHNTTAPLLTSPNKYVFSVFLKKLGRTYVGVQSWYNSSSGAIIYVNLDNGTIEGTFEEGTGFSVTNAEIESHGDGWYRVSGVFTSAATTHYYGVVAMDSLWSSGTSYDNAYAGDSTKGFYWWGMQLEQADEVGAYIPNYTASKITSDVLLPAGLTTGRDITGVNLFENVRKQGALNLDGNSWAEVHDNASLDITDAITLEAWVYWDGASDKGILGRWDLVNSKRSYLLYQSGTKFRFYVSSDGSVDDNQQNTTAISNGWNHIVGVYDGSKLYTYLNGSADGSKNYTSDIYANDSVIEIGRYRLNSGFAYNDQIAQPRIYNRALTAEEVERNYNAGKNIYK